MSLYFAKHFIKHYTIATPIDVLHSPFVFELYNNCIKRQNQKPDAFNKIEALRNTLKQSKESVYFTDFGAVGQNKSTTISYIAKTHAKPARIAAIIYYLVQHLQPQKSIELGTSLALTTAYFASALNNKSTFISIEGCEDVYNKAIENLCKLGLNQKVINKLGLFDELFLPVLNELGKLDCLFIDGNHTYEATMDYFNKSLAYIHNNSFIIFDDIYWSKGMTKAWNEICAHSATTACIDLFYIGIVFFRKEQQKQIFKLRVW
ncbi:MAG: O-methyltransferase [Bacteroidia bacterium]